MELIFSSFSSFLVVRHLGSLSEMAVLGVSLCCVCVFFSSSV